MNIRAIRKREFRCRAKLIKTGDYSASDFTPADGDEALCAPSDLPERHQSPHGFVRWGVLKGVPLVWITSGYYEPETDAHLPSELWNEWKFVNETEWDKVAAEEFGEGALARVIEEAKLT